MKSDFQPRPQSKNRNTKARPVSRYANIELAQESFKNGKELQSKQAYDKAIQQYFRALMYDPNYFQAYCNTGSCYRAQGKYLQSRSMYLKSISIKSDDAISQYNLANVQRIIGNYQNSINHYEIVIKLGESGSQDIGSLLLNSLVNLGICYKITQQYERSIECFEKAKKIDSNDEIIIYNQAMTYMAILQNLNIDVFYEVSKQKAEKAKALLQKLIKNNPNHEMANIKLCRVSSILDKSNTNLNQNVAKLKSMLSNQKITLKDQINSQLGYILKLLKEYEQSATHYNQSFNKKQQKIPAKVIETTNVYDSSQGYLNTKLTIFSEEQAIKLIKQGNIDEVKKSLQRMQEKNISKHAIQLAIQLELTQTESQDHFKKALQIYNKYFTQNKVELAFEQISIQAHKLIGKILAKQNKYKQSIKHFEYISSQLKSNVERSAVHTSLGSDYQALGDQQKALQQYKLALQQEPDNYQLIYNVGCCLYDRGDREQSNKYFQNFLDLIKKDTKILLSTKNLYIADCLVTMAGATADSSQQFQRYENAWKAIKEIQQGQSSDQVQFDNEKMLNYYLRWADLLEQKMVNILDKKSENYISTKQSLTEVYMCLLSTQGCPDRDAILNNCSILYYEEKLYMNALANLNQISIHTSFSLNSLALTYLHLGQHFMATKSIYAAAQMDNNDPLIMFNKQLFQWVYGIDKAGRLYNLYNNQTDSFIFVRWQYAILVIDSLSKKLKNERGDVVDSKINQYIQSTFQKDNIQLYLEQIQKIKFNFIVTKLHSANEFTNKSKTNIDHLINLCITPSHNLEVDLKNLMEKLNNKQLNDIIPQILLNIFIFTNKDKGHSMKTYLQKHYHKKQEIYPLQMDRRVTINEDLIRKVQSFSNTSDIIEKFCSWQCQIENKLIVLLHHIEKKYYHHSVRYPLEVEYHFPRHNQLQECSITVNRIIFLIHNIFNIKTNIKIKEKTISAMKYELIDEIQSDFQIHMRKQPFITIQLGQKLKIITLHANFNSKQQCVKFIKQLQKECSVKTEIDLRRHEQEITLLISGIVAISCTWSQKDALKNSIKALLNSSLQLYLQAILQIQENLFFIQDPSENLWQKLSSIKAFGNK